MRWLLLWFGHTVAKHDLFMLFSLCCFITSCFLSSFSFIRLIYQTDSPLQLLQIPALKAKPDTILVMFLSFLTSSLPELSYCTCYTLLQCAANWECSRFREAGKAGVRGKCLYVLTHWAQKHDKTDREETGTSTIHVQMNAPYSSPISWFKLFSCRFLDWDLTF